MHAKYDYYRQALRTKERPFSHTVEGVAGRGCQKQSPLKETGSLSYGGFSFFFNVVLFIYFWLCWIFVAVQVFLSLQRTGFSSCGSSCCGAWAPGLVGFSSCSAQASFPRWHVGSSRSAQASFPRWHVGSSCIRGWILVSCTGRQILYH